MPTGRYAARHAGGRHAINACQVGPVYSAPTLAKFHRRSCPLPQHYPFARARARPPAPARGTQNPPASFGEGGGLAPQIDKTPQAPHGSLPALTPFPPLGVLSALIADAPCPEIPSHARKRPIYPPSRPNLPKFRPDKHLQRKKGRISAQFLLFL